LRIAVTREVSPGIARCELTHLARQAIDVEKACSQHQAFEDVLTSLGCRVRRLPAEPGLPDSVFIEDTAVVLDELAVVTRPGASSRRKETESVAEALKRHRPLFRIEAPGTLDGGDVLQFGKTLYVGQTGRTNTPGIKQLASLASPYDYQVEAVRVEGCLHLKSAVSSLGEGRLLVNRDWVDTGPFKAEEYIDVDPLEPFGANALLVGGTLVYPANYPRTQRRLEAGGIPVRTVDMSELQKAEGGVTCCALFIGVGPQ
jgi:dimethylargininase